MDAQVKKEFVLTRTFNAPIKIIWDVFTQAKHLKHWWGPKGFKLNVANLNFTPNGTFLYSMTSLDGTIMWAKFVYREIENFKKIVYVVSFTDESGRKIRYVSLPVWPLEILYNATFTENNERTTISLKSFPINATQEEFHTFEKERASMQEGFDGTWQKLDKYLEKLNKQNNK